MSHIEVHMYLYTCRYINTLVTLQVHRYTMGHVLHREHMYLYRYICIPWVHNVPIKCMYPLSTYVPIEVHLYLYRYRRTCILGICTYTCDMYVLKYKYIHKHVPTISIRKLILTFSNK